MIVDIVGGEYGAVTVGSGVALQNCVIVFVFRTFGFGGGIEDGVSGRQCELFIGSHVRR